MKMRMGWRTFVGLCIALMVTGAIAIIYFIDPSALTFGPSSQDAPLNSLPNSSTSPPSSNSGMHEIRITATASYCNCTTDTDSQG
ncbi:MAG: hypothetical protein OK457_08455 [Thaumarchaeota archaeon]|nr:hypothetical protein [Nitrososphaerota archaeon]